MCHILNGVERVGECLSADYELRVEYLNYTNEDLKVKRYIGQSPRSGFKIRTLIASGYKSTALDHQGTKYPSL